MINSIIFLPEITKHPNMWGYLVVYALYMVVGKKGLEPSRLTAHDPKSCLSANSSTSPQGIIREGYGLCKNLVEEPEKINKKLIIWYLKSG